MSKKRNYLILGFIFIIIASVIIIAIIRVSYKQPQLERINLRGDSQIGLNFIDYRPTFMYTSFQFIGDSSKTNIIIKLNKKDIVLNNNYYFGGFINDTLCITFDLIGYCYLHTKKENDLFTQRLFNLSMYKFEFNLIKPSILNNTIGFYFIDYEKLGFFDLKDSIILTLIKYDEFGKDYSEISSFDIYNEVGVFCLKRDLINNNFYFDFYLYDFKNNKTSFIIRTPKTQVLPNEPLVRFINDTTVLASYYLNEKTLLYKIDLLKNKVIETYNLEKNKVIINISSNKKDMIYLTLLNEKVRDSLSINNNNVERGMYGGINVYSFVP